MQSRCLVTLRRVLTCGGHQTIWSLRAVQNIQKFLTAVVVLGLSLTGMAQQNNPSLPRSKPQAAATTRLAKLTREQKFVIDTVKMAVALPESDPQDRLRVLSTAADVVSPIDKKMARGFWQ